MSAARTVRLLCDRIQTNKPWGPSDQTHITVSDETWWTLDTEKNEERNGLVIKPSAESSFSRRRKNTRAWQTQNLHEPNENLEPIVRQQLVEQQCTSRPTPVDVIMLKPRLNRHHTSPAPHLTSRLRDEDTGSDGARQRRRPWKWPLSIIAGAIILHAMQGCTLGRAHSVVAMSLVARPRVEYKQSIAFLAAHALFHIEQAFYARSSYAKSPPCPLPAPSPAPQTHLSLWGEYLSTLPPKNM